MKLLVGLLTVLFTANSFEFTLGAVDVQKVIMNTNEGKKIRSQLEKEFKKKQETLTKEEQKIKKMQEDYKKQSVVMSDKAKAKKQGEIRQSMMKVQQQMNTYQQEIQQMESRLTQPLLKKIMEVVDEVSKKEDVDMTINTVTSPVIYSKKQVDITQKVIDAYNKKHK